MPALAWLRFPRFGPRLAVVAGTSVCAAALAAQTEADYLAQTRRLARIHVESLVSEWLAATGVPGGAIALVEGRDLLVLEGFGSADVQRRVPIDPHQTLFQVAELVRPLTAMAALRLVDDGLLDLDTDVAAYVDPALLESDFAQPVTVRHLLTHTAGLEVRLAGSRTRRLGDLLPLAAYLHRRMPARVHPPGLVSISSSHGYALVGLLIETLAGRPFADYLRRRLFVPLGMAHTEVAVVPSTGADVATGYRLRAGRQEAVEPDASQTPPASTLLTTAADMGRWMRAELDDRAYDGGSILKRDSARQLLTRQFSNHGRLPGRSLAFREGDRYSPRELFQAARGNGFSAALVLVPHRRLGLFAAFNGESDFWSLLYGVLDQFERPRSGPTADPGSASVDAAEFSGYWRDAAVSHTTVEKLSALIRQDRTIPGADGTLGWRGRRFRPVGPLAFQRVGGRQLLCFIADDQRVRFAVTPNAVLEKLSWHRAQPVQAGIWVTFAAVFLAAAGSLGRLPSRAEALRPADAFSPRWPFALARLAAVLHLLFMASLAVMLAVAFSRDIHPLLYGVGLPLMITLTLPLLAAALTVPVLVGLWSVWRQRRWTPRQRLRFTLLAAALVAFLALLHSWNLLGLRF